MKDYISIALFAIGVFGTLGTVIALDTRSISIYQALAQWIICFVCGYCAIIIGGDKHAI